jgi:hypothetical protein
MRRVLFVLAIVSCITPARVRAAAPSSAVIITAQSIALHSDRGLLVADGGVAVHGPVLQLTATRAAYDLRANRLIAVGDVAVKIGSRTLTATGYVYDFNTKRGGLEKSAVVPQLSNLDALVLGQQVELRPASSLTFSNAQVLAGSAFTPIASYTYAIAPPTAKDFGYSPVPSAALEWPVLIASSRNAYQFARFRFDRYNGGPGTGLEEHYARTDRGYIAFGQTLDVNGGRFDLAAYQRLNAALSQAFTGSYLLGTHAWRYVLSSSGAKGYASFSTSQYNASRSDDVLVSANQRAIGRVASARPQLDLGHDVHPGDAPVQQDFRITPGVHVDSAALRIGPTSLTSSFDLGESLYDYGRGTLSSSATLWFTMPFTARMLVSGGATFSHNAPPYPATYRTYTLGTNWHASDAFNLVTSLNYTPDFGQAYGSGRPQDTAAFDVLVTRRNGTGVEVGTLIPFGCVGDMNRQAVLNVRFIK